RPARLRMVVALLLARPRCVAQARVVGAGMDALDRRRRAAAGVDLYVEPFLLEVAAREPQPHERGLSLEAPVERHLDLGLRACGRRKRQQQNKKRGSHYIALLWDAEGEKP